MNIRSPGKRGTRPLGPPARALRALEALVADRRGRAALVAVNLLGAVYGFLWYREQLAATAVWLWPVVPDSPLSALLFGLTLLRRDPPGQAPSWVALARMATFKYGLWTVVVLGGAALRARALDPESALLIATHAGMALEAWLLFRAEPPAAGARRAALALLLLNDAFDYGPLRTHPRLPDPSAFAFVAAEAVTLSLLAAWTAARAHSRVVE